MRMRPRAAALVVLLALACGARRTPPPPAPSSAVAAAEATPWVFAEVPALSRYELAFDLPDRTLHPDDVVIEARFTSPSGKTMTVGGFPSHGRFVVRFTPREEGPHDFVIHANGGSGMIEIERGTLVAKKSNARGFVRSDREHRRLVDDRGRTAFVLGENRINVYDPAWNWDRLGITDYLRRMKSAGMTAIRVFIFADCVDQDTPDGYRIGCLENGIGRFDERTADAFDELFDAAEATDIDVILVAFAIGYTPPPETWRAWADNPYSAQRGGPVSSPVDFFADPRLRPMAIRKLRYIADRWASSPRLLAIDLLNEPEWDGPIPESVWIPWAEEMSEAWRRLEPYGHLVTAGPVGPQSNIDIDERRWYASDANDIVQWHLYGSGFYDPYAVALEMARKVEESWGFEKPILCGEFAYGGEHKPAYDHTHNGIWSLLLSGAGALAHSAPQFQVDSDEPMTPERAAHFRVLSDFISSFDPSLPLRPAHDVQPSDAEAKVLGLTSPAGARAIWILGPRKTYGSPVKALRLKLPAPPKGAWLVTWIDDVTGKQLARRAIDSTGKGEVTLDVPTFVRHVAARVLPR